MHNVEFWALQSTPPRISRSRNACIIFPGNKIPEWYNYQSTGCSIDIKLTNSECTPQSKFLGFSCCLVAAFKEHNYSKIGLPFRVVVHSKINSGKSFKDEIWYCAKPDGITSWIPYPHDTDEDEQIIIISGKEEPTIINSDHVFMCYESRSLWNCYEPLKEGFITDISLRFFPVVDYFAEYYPVVDSCEVKSCGVRLLYCQEAKELGFSIPVFSKNCDYRLRRHLRPEVYFVNKEDEDTKEEADSDDDFIHVQNLRREGYYIYDIAPVDEDEEDEDFANVHDVIWGSNVEYYGSEAAAIDSTAEEKEDDEAVANSRDVIGESKVEEVHENKEVLHPATVQEEDKEDNELKSTSSFGCLQFLSHHFRAIFECILGKNSGLEQHLDSSPTSSRFVASSPSIEFHERLRAKDETIQNLESQNKHLLHCL